MPGYLGSPIAILPTMSTIRLATDTRLAGRTLMFFPSMGLYWDGYLGGILELQRIVSPGI